MRKILFLFIILIILFTQIQYTSANWYGNHTVSYTNPGGESLTPHPITPTGPLDNGTNCDEDSDPTGDATADGEPPIFEGIPKAYAVTDSTGSLVPIGGTNDVPPSGDMNCLYWDHYPPEPLSITYDFPNNHRSYPSVPNYGWANDDVVITVEAQDEGGSLLKSITLERCDVRDHVSVGQISWGGGDSCPTGWQVVNVFNSSGGLAAGGPVVGPTGGTVVGPGFGPGGPVVGPTGGTVVGPGGTVVGPGGTVVGPGGTVAGTGGLNLAFASLDWTQTPVHEAIYFYRIYAEDIALNVTDPADYEYNYNLIKFDTEAPDLVNDVTNNDPLELQADDSYLYTIEIIEADGDPGKSPIDVIDFKYEDYASNFPLKDEGTLAIDASWPLENTGSWLGNPSIRSGYPGSWTSSGSISFVWDMSDVDNITGRDVDPDPVYSEDRARQYTYRLVELCDLAGNCSTDSPQDYNHNVYADSDTNLFTFKIVDSTDRGNLEGSGGIYKIADGTTNPLKITLKDQYLNQFIPAPTIDRVIDFNFDVTNTSDINQYNQTISEIDAIYVSTPTQTGSFDNRLSTSTGFNDEQSINGIYPFNFKVYAPTEGGSYIHAIGDFSINSIDFDITQTLDYPFSGGTTGTLIGNSTGITFNFDPIYRTSFSGEQIEYGFIEGAIQSGSINISQTGSETTGNNKLYLEFGYTAENFPSTDFDLFASGGSRLFSSPAIGEGYSTTLNGNKLFWDPFSSGATSLQTKITSSVASVLAVSEHYLSTHINYTLPAPSPLTGDIEVTYNSDIVGKDIYSGAINKDTNTVGIRIDGKTSTEHYSEILDGQENSNIKIIGELTKSELSGLFKPQVYSYIKSLSNFSTTYPSSINDLSGLKWTSPFGGKIADNGNVLYFGGVGTLKLGDGSDELVEGRKTIIVNGGDLYIKSNMYYGDRSSDILGIIVLEDSGNGGHVYIDPEVTNIVGTIYADKVILNYDGTNEIDGYTNQSLLKNQIHMFGSIFTKNTIGGAREATPVCPYYITSCDLETAQKYDLNYLRRYFTFQTASGSLAPANNGKVAGGGTFDQTNGNYNGDGEPDLYRNIMSTGSEYFKHPVIVEYNSLIQSKQPPIFRID